MTNDEIPKPQQPETSMGAYAVLTTEILLASDITDGQKILLGLITGLTRNTGFCYASNEYLAKHLGKSAGAVSNSISDLVDKNYLIRYVQRDERKVVVSRALAVRTMSKQAINLINPTHQIVGTPPHQMMDTSPSNSGIEYTLNNTLVNNTLKTNKKNNKLNINSENSIFAESDRQEFERFYNLYDKKVSKDDAIKAWKKLKRSDIEAIFANVQAYVASTPEKQYRPNPASYLNGRKWLDEIITRPTTNAFGKTITNIKPDYNKGLDDNFLVQAITPRRRPTGDSNWNPDVIN